MKTVVDIAMIVNHHCYDRDDVCDNTWCACCEMCTIAEKMILRGDY